MATVTLIALAGATLHLSAFQGSFWFVRRGQALHGWVALWGLAALSHQCGRLGHLWAETPESAVLWLKVSFGGILLSGAVAPYALRSLCGVRGHPWMLWLLGGVSLVLCGLLGGQGLVTDRVHPYTDAMGRAYLWVDIGPWTPLWLVWGLSLLGSGHWLIRRSALVKRRERLVLYLVTLLYVGPGVHDALLGMGLFDSIVLFDYAFAFVVFGFGWIATQRFEDTNADLEVEVAARTAQLAEALREVKQAADDKEGFFASVTHEIRTPLHGLQATTEMLSESLTDPAHRRLAGIATQATADLRALVDDLLDASSLDAGRLAVHSVPIELAPLLAELVVRWEPRAESKGLKLSLSLPPEQCVVLADETRLSQVLANLLSNALKFTEQGAVTLKVSALPDRVRFSVSDTGRGIGPAEQNRVFERFHQGTARAGGTGLGLTIAQGLVAAMGGKLTLDSRLGEGSTFSFELDRSYDEEAPRLSLPPDAGTGVVLIADDNPVNREIVRLALARLGVIVDEAVDGFGAVSRALRGGLDLILMDLHMPGLDGIEATRRIRAARTAVGGVAIVAMTASTDAEDHRLARAAGMNDVLGKPLDISVLRAVVSEYVALGVGPIEPSGRLDLRALFIDDAEQRLSAVDTSSAREIKQVAHAIRGAAANLGLTDIAQLCRELEADPETPGERLQRLREQVAAAATPL